MENSIWKMVNVRNGMRCFIKNHADLKTIGVFKNLLLVMFICTTIKAQTIIINVNGVKANSAALNSLQGEKTFFIDSIVSIKKDIFTYTFEKYKKQPGIYRISFNNDNWLDFIYDNENVNIS
jgi:hypothetical protein